MVGGHIVILLVIILMPLVASALYPKMTSRNYNWSSLESFI
jgi:hypothetical protein